MDAKDYGLIYLATPYSKWHEGIHNAYAEAAKLAARLMKAGYQVYSPIVNTHPLAIYGNIDPYAHDIWLPFDQTMMDKADTLFVAELEGWSESGGVKHEIEVFYRQNKPVHLVEPETLYIVGGVVTRCDMEALGVID